MKTMTLGELITALSRKDADLQVYFDFARFQPTSLDSYRGDYSQLALGYGDGAVTVAILLKEFEAADGRVFTGWKGGDYTMQLETPVYVAQRGEWTGTGIVDVTLEDSAVYLKTAYVGLFC